MSFAQGVTVVRALCVFYYEKSALGEKSRNRMRDEVLKKIVLLREKGKSA